MSKFIAHNSGNCMDSPKFAIYEKGVNGDFFNVNNKDKYFSADNVSTYPHAFLFADSLDKIAEEIKKKIHVYKYGNGENGDCECPDCGYKYPLYYYDNNDGYYTPAIIEDYSTIIHCICGCKFEAKIKVKVSFSSKKI